MARRKTEWRPTASRRIRRQRIRYEDDVREDLVELKVQNWSKMAMDGEGCKRIAEQSKTQREEETGSTLKQKLSSQNIFKISIT